MVASKKKFQALFGELASVFMMQPEHVVQRGRHDALKMVGLLLYLTDLLTFEFMGLMVPPRLYRVCVCEQLHIEYLSVAEE